MVTSGPQPRTTAGSARAARTRSCHRCSSERGRERGSPTGSPRCLLRDSLELRPPGSPSRRQPLLVEFLALLRIVGGSIETLVIQVNGRWKTRTSALLGVSEAWHRTLRQPAPP